MCERVTFSSVPLSDMRHSRSRVFSLLDFNLHLFGGGFRSRWRSDRILGIVLAFFNRSIRHRSCKHAEIIHGYANGITPALLNLISLYHGHENFNTFFLLLGSGIHLAFLRLPHSHFSQSSLEQSFPFLLQMLSLGALLSGLQRGRKQDRILRKKSFNTRM